MTKKSDYHQQGQTVKGHQINARGVVKVEHLGDKINTGGGDYVEGDKHIHIHQTPTKPENPHLSFEPETVHIPAGVFIMGEDTNPLATPQHPVTLPDFRMGIYPVTNAQYAEFIWDTKHTVGKELLWDGNQPPEGRLNHPVAGVTWYDAYDYCQWLSKQTGRSYTLPSEAQWEKGARGEDGRIYPWGNAWLPDRCNINLNELTTVDAFPAQSPYGCFDMVGNTREWTSTLWGTSSSKPDKRYRYPWSENGRNDPKAPPTVYRVFRGGRWRTASDHNCSLRRSYPPTDCGPKRNRHGFRIAQYLGGSHGT